MLQEGVDAEVLKVLWPEEVVCRAYVGIAKLVRSRRVTLVICHVPVLIAEAYHLQGTPTGLSDRFGKPFVICPAGEAEQNPMP